MNKCKWKQPSGKQLTIAELVSITVAKRYAKSIVKNKNAEDEVRSPEAEAKCLDRIEFLRFPAPLFAPPPPPPAAHHHPPSPPPTPPPRLIVSKYIVT